MKKVIALYSQVPSIHPLMEKSDGIENRAKQRASFLRKQMSDLKEETQKEFDLINAELLEILRAEDILPTDFDDTKMQFEIDQSSDCIFITEKDSELSHDIPPMIQQLFDQLRPKS